MQILCVCPAKVATGGTESIHNLVHHLCKAGADARVLYVGKDLNDPQPEEYKKYGCIYHIGIPADFHGVVILPEIMANQITDEYKAYKVAVHWQGVDVYYWSNPERTHDTYLCRGKCIHIANCEYAMNHLRSKGLKPIKVSDALNDDFFQDFTEEYERSNVVLYNPTAIKLTDFQKIIMARCTTEYGIKFQPICGYSRSELIDLFRHSKLYIDFGVFSGRERLPREAVMCGCCIITSKTGAAGYYEDVHIPDRYKLQNEEKAIKMIKYVLDNFETCRNDFNKCKEALKQDKQNYPKEVEALYNEILSYYSGV